MWEHFHHLADIGIRGTGDSPPEAFAEGAMAMSAVICNPATVEPVEVVEIECTGQELDYLFFDWINALIYEMDVRKMLFSRFEVNIENDTLTGKAWGEVIDEDKHEIAVGIKAATFMELKVFQNDQRQWIAQCVVDV